MPGVRGREEFSLDASNVFVFGNRTHKRGPSHFNLPVALLKAGRGWARTGAVQLVAQLLPGRSPLLAVGLMENTVMPKTPAAADEKAQIARAQAAERMRRSRSRRYVSVRQ